MNNRLKAAIEWIINDCQFAGGVDMTKEQLTANYGTQTACCLVELRAAFREAYPEMTTNDEQ